MTDCNLPIVFLICINRLHLENCWMDSPACDLYLGADDCLCLFMFVFVIVFVLVFVSLFVIVLLFVIVIAFANLCSLTTGLRKLQLKNIWMQTPACPRPSTHVTFGYDIPQANLYPFFQEETYSIWNKVFEFTFLKVSSIDPTPIGKRKYRLFYSERQA